VPLILSLKEGDNFTVDGKRLVVKTVTKDRHFVLHHEESDTHFECVMDRMSEVESDVFVSSGDRANQNTARVVIDAPRSIEIKRGKA
jgi:hypothetical protein